ncbi:MAG: FGGY-family carbohydrate kinase [Pseudomonadota bacterium]
MGQPLLIGVDAGSTSVKAVLFDKRGSILGEAYRETPVNTDGEHITFPVRKLTDAALNTIADVVRQKQPADFVAGIAFASVGESFVLFDETGDPLDDIIAWYDRRAADEADEIAAAIGNENLLSITGLEKDPIYSLCKLLWLRRNQPELLARARGMAFVADWLAFCVSGERATDMSLASRSLLAAPMTGKWAPEMLGGFDIEEAFLPKIVPAGTSLGPPTPWAQERLGLTERCIVSVGGHDHILSSIAAGAASPELLVDSAGTAEAILRTGPSLVTAWPEGTLEFAQGGIWWAGLPKPIIYLIGAMFDSGGALSRFRSGTCPELSWDQLIAQAAHAPPVTARFDAQLGQGREADPAAWSAAVLSGSDDVGAQFRALLEGLALDSRLLCDRLTEHAGLPPVQEIRLVGGLAKNQLYATLKAAAFNKPIRVAEFPEFTALGAAMAAGIGAEVYGSLDDALETVHVEWRECLPDPTLVASAQSLLAARPAN